MWRSFTRNWHTPPCCKWIFRCILFEHSVTYGSWSWSQNPFCNNWSNFISSPSNIAPSKQRPIIRAMITIISHFCHWRLKCGDLCAKHDDFLMIRRQTYLFRWREVLNCNLQFHLVTLGMWYLEPHLLLYQVISNRNPYGLLQIKSMKNWLRQTMVTWDQPLIS